MPRLFGLSGKNVVVLRIELNVILVQVIKELLSTQDLRDLNELVRVAVSMKERLFAEDHRGKHGAQGPHIERVVILLEVN